MSIKKSVFICLGSNLNDPVSQLKEARNHIEHQISRIMACSSIYQTEAWGLRKQPDYFNQVIRLDSTRTAEKILFILLDIETRMGRKRTGVWEPRIIDLDILFYGQDRINKKNLIVPHPRLHERLFNLVPLMEIAPNWVHPIFGKTVVELAEICPDALMVRKLTI